MATRTRSSINIGSQEIVAINSRSLLEQQSHGDKVQTTSEVSFLGRTVVETNTGRTTGTNVIKSLMPDGLTLNARALEYTVDGLREDVIDANADKNKVRTQQEIPTADYVVRNSYKVGAKLLIKIERTRKTTKIPENEPQLVFNKFSLQAIAESDAERYQLQETFEDEVLYLFGRRPRVWTMQGIVLNGRRSEMPSEEDLAVFVPSDRADVIAEAEKKNMDWANNLLINWERYYRGSKAVEARTRTYLAYDDSVIEATLLELVMARNAQMPTSVNATLTFVVHQRSFMGQSTDGIESANLRDLIEKTNQAGAFEDKIKPSDTSKADLELAEVNRQQLAAEEELRQAQEDVKEAVAEETNIKDSLAQATQDLTQATAQKTAAQSDLAAAQDLAPTTPEGIDEQDKQIADAKKAIAEADEQLESVNSRGQALTAASNAATENTNQTVWTEEGSKIKSDTIAAYADNMSGGMDFQDEADATEFWSGAVEDDYNNITNAQYDDSTGWLTFTADNPDGGTIDVIYDTNTGQALPGGA